MCELRRLYSLNENEIEQWQTIRMQFGEEQYGDAHLNRYNLVDIAEELLDAIHIHSLFVDRIRKSPTMYSDHSASYLFRLSRSFINTMMQGFLLLQQMDQLIEDGDCTDAQGGDRIGIEVLQKQKED